MKESALTKTSFAGLSATFVGNGIGRFAYIALMPALISSGWFSKGEASYLGVATLVGYLLGAPLANYLVRRFTTGQIMRSAMVMCSLSYLACAFPDAPLLWFYFWRTLAGVGGAILMVMAAPAVLRYFSEGIRGRVSGVVFSGIGLGAMMSGTLIPLLILQSVSAAWLGMGSICLLLTIINWRTWDIPLPDQAVGAKTHEDHQTKVSSAAVALILSAYTLNAIGYLPHTLFWVDYIVRELHMSLWIGGLCWAVFGIGAALGPLFTGQMGDRFGFKQCLIACFMLKAFGVVLPLLSNHLNGLLVSSFLVGAFTPGIVALVSAYTLECVGIHKHRRAWSIMTFSFAVSQAVVGYIMAYVVSDSISYRPLFLVSSMALLISAICILFTRVKPVDTANVKIIN
ncbi:MAG: MFS transporter [Burkholderiales bacterium]|jgi:MFS family permease|nr:MFS transporter [Burkholderiales bacterium]